MNGTTRESDLAQAVRPDPSKHVRYTRGMVLGVDDFTQDFAYLTGRDEWLARDAIGYGTVSGLKVRTEPDGQTIRVVVARGVALSPRGQMIRVCADQCANVHDWIASHRAELEQHADRRLATTPDDAVSLYVVLCYRDCPTDPLPIPGEPCRGEDEVMAESRTSDDFRLELRFEPPDQREEDALRAFVAWLAAIEVGEDGEFPGIFEFSQAIRDAAEALGSPPRSAADFMVDSPPAWLRIRASQANEYFRAAFRVWVTELRPLWRPAALSQGCSCGSRSEDGRDAEDCVLLSQLRVPLRHDAIVGTWSVPFPALVEVHDDRRPYVPHVRLMHEWALFGAPGGGRRASPGPTGPTGETGLGLSSNFTRIVALSWQHDRTAPLINVTRAAPSTLVQGLVIAFGLVDAAGQSTLVDVVFGPRSGNLAGSLDPHTFQVSTLEPQGTTGPASRQFYGTLARRDNAGTQVLAELIPVEIQALDATGRIVTAARERAVDANGRTSTNGAALMLHPNLITSLAGRELFVELNGDFILDFRGLAVDGDFLRGQLPSGNGVEGGTFRSWFRLP
jgi:hypothetical protein